MRSLMAAARPPGLPWRRRSWIPTTAVSAAACAFSSSATALTVQDFVQRPHVQQALHANPKTPQSVLTFFFGVDYNDPQQVESQLEQGLCLEEMVPLWFYGGGEYDLTCSSFAAVVRQAGQFELDNKKAWSATVEGVAAQLVLCDQISRNTFRGTPEAFAYDDAALEYAHRLAQHVVETPSLVGPLYAPYLSPILLALMHSESAADHEQCLQVLEVAEQDYATTDALAAWWKNQKAFELEHKQVIDRFGRYPHRNKLKGRSSTVEEQAWLDDVDNLPGWAKSQG